METQVTTEIMEILCNSATIIKPYQYKLAKELVETKFSTWKDRFEEEGLKELKKIANEMFEERKCIQEDIDHVQTIVQGEILFRKFYTINKLQRLAKGLAQRLQEDKILEKNKLIDEALTKTREKVRTLGKGNKINCKACKRDMDVFLTHCMKEEKRGQFYWLRKEYGYISVCDLCHYINTSKNVTCGYADCEALLEYTIY